VPEKYDFQIKFFEKLTMHISDSTANGGPVYVAEKLQIEVLESGAFCFPDYTWIWHDFIPCKLTEDFVASFSELPSLLFYVPEVSDVLNEGAYWFTFVFEWWFASSNSHEEKIASKEEPKLIWPCTSCDIKFAQEWEVSLHFINVHVTTKKTEGAPKFIHPPKPPEPEPVEEEEFWPNEDEFDPLPFISNWYWQDFLPDWPDEIFLPSALAFYFPYEDTLEIDGMEEERLAQAVPPPSKSRPSSFIAPDFQIRFLAPILKQTKYLCVSCNHALICNSCFKEKCSSHNVTFKGQAKFACEKCSPA